MPRIPVDAPATAIVQRAAALFAAHGIGKTSLQDIAAALDVSKAAVLHHFGSRAALEEAVLGEAAALVERTVAPLRGRPEGPDRDVAAITAIVDCALAHPGPVGLVLGATATGDPSGRLAAVEGSVLEAFHDDPADLPPDRVVRLSAALAAAGVVAVTAHHRRLGEQWRDPLVAACIDALGRSAPDRPEDHP